MPQAELSLLVRQYRHGGLAGFPVGALFMDGRTDVLEIMSENHGSGKNGRQQDDESGKDGLFFPIDPFSWHCLPPKTVLTHGCKTWTTPWNRERHSTNRCSPVRAANGKAIHWLSVLREKTGYAELRIFAGSLTSRKCTGTCGRIHPFCQGDPPFSFTATHEKRRTYGTEGSGNSRNGYGVTTHHPPSNFAGDRYVGQYKDGLRSGLGVYAFGTNTGNPSQKLRREGEDMSNLSNGLGTVLWVSGERHAGHWKIGQCSGPGVRTYADGRRYEGDYVADKRSRLGVLWSANGLVASAGIWKDGKLATALAH